MRRINKNRTITFAAIALALISLGVASVVYAKYTSSASDTVTLSVEKSHYTVIFDANGGTGSMEYQDFVYGEEQALLPNAFTRQDFGFAGWNTMADGTGISFTDEQSVKNLAESGLVYLYAQWEEGNLRTVFRQEGACIFGGASGVISGDECTDYAGRQYIDTGVKLYNSENIGIDYEIGFTINSYVANNNEQQATFVEDKYESQSASYPGFVVRKNNTGIEVTQTINGNKVSQNLPAANGMTIVIKRVSGVVYYSVNGGDLEVLQSTLGLTNYFDNTVWFGAAEAADHTPMRFLTATLSNLYVKVGNNYNNGHTVTFNADGGTVDPTSIDVSHATTIANLPTPTKENMFFVGWYTEDGARVTSDTPIMSDVELHARWRDTNTACSVGGEEKDTLAQCISAADSSQTPVTVTLLRDTEEHISVGAGQNINFDFGDFILSNANANNPVIENYGTINITNGVIKSSATAGAINNESGAVLHMSGGRVEASGTKQAIYNNGGDLKISGTAYLRSTSTSRATVHNLNNGTIWITGGAITSVGSDAVQNDSGEIVIGVEDGSANSTSPVIQGARYGVSATANIGMYDGVLRGRTAAINNVSKISATEQGAIRTEDTVSINGQTYRILYYENDGD